MKLIIFVAVAAFYLLFSPYFLNAETKSIVINEVMANPIGSDTQFEWIELYNYSEESIDITGWKLDDQMLSSYVIEPHSYLLLVRDKSSFGEIENSIEANFSLVNSSDMVILKNTEGIEVDSFHYENSVEGKSFEKRGPLCLEINPHANSSTINAINSNYISACFPETLIEEPVEPEVLSTTLQISELYPNINVGEEEWVEIYNFGSEVINLDRFYFADAKECGEVSEAKFLAGIVNPKEHAILTKSQNQITLNDSGDSINLCTQTETIDSFTYESSVKSKSISKIFQVDRYLEGSNFTEPTPGEINFIEILEIISIKEARSQQNTKVKIEGIINSAYEALFEDTFYIQDSTAGVRILFKGDLTFLVGSKVIVEGTVSSVDSEVKINADSVEILETSSVSPIQLINFEDLQGIYVFTEGYIISNYSSGFDLETSVGILRIAILSRTNIELPEKSKGDFVKVRGIMSKDKTRYKLLPLNLESIEIISQSEVEEVVSKPTSKTKILGESILTDQSFTVETMSVPKFYSAGEKQKEENAPIILLTAASGLGLLLYSVLIRKDLLALYNKTLKKDSFNLELPKVPSKL